MIGEYKIKIWKDEDYYLAEVTFPDKETHITQGTEKDIFYMIGDLMACCHDIEFPFWKRFLIKIFRL